MQEQTQVNKIIFVFEQYRETSQGMTNARKKQFKSCEISGKEISFQIMSFGTIEYYPRCNNVKGFRSSTTIGISLYT